MDAAPLATLILIGAFVVATVTYYLIHVVRDVVRALVAVGEFLANVWRER